MRKLNGNKGMHFLAMDRINLCLIPLWCFFSDKERKEARRENPTNYLDSPDYREEDRAGMTGKRKVGMKKSDDGDQDN